MNYTIRKPVERKILVKQKDVIKQSKTGLTINVRNDNWLKEQIGEIVCVADGVIDKDLIPGEHVFFSKYAGANGELNGQKYIILSESEIFGILEQDQEDFTIGETLDTEGLLDALKSHGNLPTDEEDY